jgi:hypothetical protein
LFLDSLHQVLEVIAQHPRVQVKQALANAFQHEQQRQQQHSQAHYLACQQYGHSQSQPTQLGICRAIHDDVATLQRALQVFDYTFIDLRALYQLIPRVDRTRRTSTCSKTKRTAVFAAVRQIILLHTVLSLQTCVRMSANVAFFTTFCLVLFLRRST